MLKDGVLMITSLYCEEQPSITPIPISACLYQMKKGGTNQCSNNKDSIRQLWLYYK